MLAKEKALIAKDAIISKKGRDVQLLDVAEITEIAEYFLIAVAGKRSQSQAIADEVMDKLEEQGETPLRKEGYENGGWILMDYGDVIIHIFMPEERDYFNLPRLWQDAKFTKFDTDGKELPQEEVEEMQTTTED